ncbi:SxtJ family membrane protein [Candidatus Pelagibacter sp.]|nr:SxtJ family membrane protein [Candidatus Pelagibacter sp.]
MKKIKLPTNRNFGVVFFLVFLFISLFPLLNYGNIRIWTVIIALVFLILGLLNSSVLSPLNKLWFKFGIMVGNLISPVVMAIIFFMVVTPTSLLVRLFGKDLLSLKKNDKETYWVKKNNIKSEMKNQF